MTTALHTVSFLGVGEMGSALARAVIAAGHPTTVWNRSPDKTATLAARGARAEYFGDDAGMASLYDLALLAGMYVMFAGFFHGAAMVGAAGVTAKEFATRAIPWLQVTAGALTDFAAIVDGGDYSLPGQQSLEFSDISDIVAASRDQGIGTELVGVVQRLIHRQIDAGHGGDRFARIIESIKHPEAS